jgi:cytosine/adenosine deaminase-related metal-dependent hydrolase
MTITEVFSRYALIGEDLELKKNVTLLIDENGKISQISCEDPGISVDITPSDQNHIVIPGLINSHTHIGDSFAKEKGFNKGLIETVAPPYGLKHNMLKKVPLEIKIEGIQNALREMLANGITCFIDFREGGVKGVEILKECLVDFPIKCMIFGRFLNVDEIESVFKIADGIGFASYKNIKKDIIEILESNIVKYDKVIACHCAELTRHCAELKRRIQIINKIIQDNIVNVVIHGTQFVKEDLERIKKNNMSLVLCPRCNGYFGVGFPPINDVMRLKIPISLGTDNLMANNTDLFEEMRYLYRISRVFSNNEEDINTPAKEFLKMITINAAKNFNLDEKIGSISEQKDADFIVIDLSAPNYYSNDLDKNTIFPLILQRTKPENIKKVFIRGVCVFERG